MSMDESESVGLSLDTSQLNGDCSEFLANDDSQGTFSDTVDSMDEASSSHSSVVADDNVSYFQPSPDRSVLGWETVDGKMAIVFFPDFIVCGNLHWNCIDFKVIFFDDCVRASGSTAHGQEEFCIELAIEDIVDIRSQREGRKEMVEVKINVIARDSQQVLNLDGTSSVEELKFSVVDSLWHEKIEEIISLNVKYKALWNFMLDTDMGVDLEALLSQEILPGPKKFIPEFVENFEEVIYPEGDPDAVSISIRDVDMLKPDTFINDTIIDFYIKYLKNTMILPEERSRFHFFNCFFFRKLADMDKDPSSAFEGRAAFLRVRKWTRKVDLFSKDFIFIPVNYSYHWSLILICHPREIAKISDENAENLARVPCILHMDSLRGSHANLKDLMQSYLWEEWKERQRGTDEAIASKFLNLRFIPLELPQQQNLYDCGLFLLHYLESFLEAHLENFSPFMMKKSEIPNFVSKMKKIFS
ncbi:hypothetical protein Leryth_004424 [Lithospermum erythrorhizon]|nr:hypothetical protein Leryth_004424 [Lithospermum erythrorhizon]